MEPFKEYLKSKKHSQSSIATYQRMLNPFISWLEQERLAPENTTYKELMSYLQHLRKRELSPRTVQGYLIAIGHYFDYLKSEKVIETNPAQYLEINVKETRKLYPILTPTQLENLYQSFEAKARKNTKATAQASAIRNKIATGLMIYQGLDVTTLGQLKTKDIDVLNGTIHVPGHRTSNPRTLSLHASQIIPIDRYINQTHKELERHFKTKGGQLLAHGYKYYYEAHRRLMQRLQKTEPQLINVQQIRASVITHWLKQYNLREVQYMAGHRHVHSTEAYQRNDTEGLQLDIDRFHPSVNT